MLDDDASRLRLRADTFVLEDVTGHMRRGKVRVPAFQRLYRWDERDVRELFDSILKGFPIGTLLLWQHAAPAAVLNYGGLRVDAPEMADAWWVVDGQQRLTTLAGVLLPESVPDDPRFQLYFDLQAEALRRPRGTTQPIAETWLPLHVVLNTSRLLGWLAEYPRRESDPQHLDRATMMAKTIREYRIPTYVVEGEDEDVLRQIFNRSNQGGKPLRQSEVFDALHGRAGDDPATLRSLSEALAATGFGHLDEQTLLRSLLAARGSDPFRDFESEFATVAEAAEAFAQTERLLRWVVEFLRDECGFPHQAVVPYKLVIPVLTRFFAEHPTPSPRSRDLLRRWIWRGAIGEVQAAGYTAALRRATKAIDGDEHVSVQRLLAQVPRRRDDRDPDVRSPRLNTAAGRLAFAVLWSMAPKDLVTGEPVDVASVIDHGMVSILGAGVVPADSALADRLLQAPTSAPVRELLADAAPEVLHSHLLEPSQLASLRDGDTAAFLGQRTRALLELQDAVWQDRAEWEANDRPPIAALVTAD